MYSSHCSVLHSAVPWSRGVLAAITGSFVDVAHGPGPELLVAGPICF
jgi:hypothetical protein